MVEAEAMKPHEGAITLRTVQLLLRATSSQATHNMAMANTPLL
jgi:hypothetical protein